MAVGQAQLPEVAPGPVELAEVVPGLADLAEVAPGPVELAGGGGAGARKVDGGGAGAGNGGWRLRPRDSWISHFISRTRSSWRWRCIGAIGQGYMGASSNIKTLPLRSLSALRSINPGPACVCRDRSRARSCLYDYIRRSRSRRGRRLRAFCPVRHPRRLRRLLNRIGPLRMCLRLHGMMKICRSLNPHLATWLRCSRL